MNSYLQLLKTIRDEGTYKAAARENMPGTTSLFGYQFRHDLQNGFPLLTTKKMFWKGVVVELLWFLRGDTNIKYLVDRNVNIWNEDAYNYYLKVTKNQSEKIPFERFIEIIKHENPEGILDVPDYILGDCGFQYGKVWRDWHTVDLNIDPKQNNDSYHKHIDQIANVIASLKSNPLGRRHIVTAWDPAHDGDLALTWCHAMFQFNCRPLTLEQRKHLYFNGTYFHPHYDNDTVDNIEGIRMGDDPDRFFTNLMNEEGINVPKYALDCQLYQRSADVFLGVPFNIASYALLTHIVAHLCNMTPGHFIHTFGDVHIYDNHQEAVNEQLSREPGELPQLIFDISNQPDHNILLDIKNVEHWTPDMFTIVNYNPAGYIKAELSTGMKK
jgi:thymidylate synthase